MNGLLFNYDGPIEPVSTYAYDQMVDHVCDMDPKMLRRECESHNLDIEGATLEVLRDSLIDAIAWERDL